MIRTRIVSVFATGLALTAGTALADDVGIVRGGENIIEVRRVEHHLHRGEGRRLTKVVTMEVDDRIVTLDKAKLLAGLSDKNDLIHVELVHENVLLDPNKDYLRQNEYMINENDLIPQAQRLARGLRANKPGVVFADPAPVMRMDVSEPTPMFIMERPEKPAPKRVIPSVPALPKKLDKAIVASAK